MDAATRAGEHFLVSMRGSCNQLVSMPQERVMELLAQAPVGVDPKFIIIVVIVVVALLLIFKGGGGAARAMHMTRTCRDCGATHPGFAKFCRRCGKRL